MRNTVYDLAVTGNIFLGDSTINDGTLLVRSGSDRLSNLI